MVDHPTQRDAEIEFHRQQNAELKIKLKQEEDLRILANTELSQRNRDVENSTRKCLYLERKLLEMVHDLKEQRKMEIISAEKIALAEKARKKIKCKRNSLKEKCNYLENQLKEVTRSNNCDSRSDNSGDGLQVEDLRENNAALTLQVKLSKHEISLQQSKVQSLERRCRQLREKLSEAQTEILCTNDFADEMEEQNKNLIHDLEDAERVLDAREAEIEMLRGGNQSFEGEHMDLFLSKANFKDLQETNTALHEELQLAETETSILENRVTFFNKKCSSNEDRVIVARVLNEKLKSTERGIPIKEHELQYLKELCCGYENEFIEAWESHEFLLGLRERELSLSEKLKQAEEECSLFKEKLKKEEEISHNLPSIEELMEKNSALAEELERVQNISTVTQAQAIDLIEASLTFKHAEEECSLLEKKLKKAKEMSHNLPSIEELMEKNLVLTEELERVKSISTVTQAQAIDLIKASLISEAHQLETQMKSDSDRLSFVSTDSSAVEQNKSDDKVVDPEQALDNLKERFRLLQELVPRMKKLQLDLQKQTKDGSDINKSEQIKKSMVAVQ